MNSLALARLLVAGALTLSGNAAHASAILQVPPLFPVNNIWNRAIDTLPVDARSDAYVTLAKPARLLSFQPHLHNRGKASCIEAIYPGGRVEMINCARFLLGSHTVVFGVDGSTTTLRAS